MSLRRRSFGAALPVVLLAVALLAGTAAWRHFHPATPPIAPLHALPEDRDAAQFTICGHGPRIDCVVDGDTIWYRGEKIRLADINAPEVSEPACDDELELGEKATVRLLALLNQGHFSLVPLPRRDTDVYGRKLRTINRGGHSLGEVLVKEGLAERWIGYRRDWCT